MAFVGIAARVIEKIAASDRAVGFEVSGRLAMGIAGAQLVGDGLRDLALHNKDIANWRRMSATTSAYIGDTIQLA